MKCVNMHSNNIIMITKHLRLFFFILIDGRSQHYRYDMRSTEWVSENSSSFRVSLFFLLSFLMLMLLQLRRSGLLNCYHALFIFFVVGSLTIIWQMCFLETNEAMMMKIGIAQNERANLGRKNSFINHSGGSEFSHSIFFKQFFSAHAVKEKHQKNLKSEKTSSSRFFVFFFHLYSLTHLVRTRRGKVQVVTKIT